MILTANLIQEINPHCHINSETNASVHLWANKFESISFSFIVYNFHILFILKLIQKKLVKSYLKKKSFDFDFLHFKTKCNKNIKYFSVNKKFVLIKF